MKVRVKYRPWLAVMKDESRPDMCHVMLDVETKKLYATNGHMAVAVGVEVNPGDKSGLIDAAGLRFINERFRENDFDDDAVISIDCSAPDFVEWNGHRVPRPKIVSQYPPIESIRPKFDDNPTHTFIINADYLRTLALALGRGDPDAEGGNWPPSVSFTALATKTLMEPILIRAYDDVDISKPEDGAEAFLMPLRS